MAAKRNALALLGALVSLCMAAPALASVPCSKLLDPPRVAVELEPTACVAQYERETPHVTTTNPNHPNATDIVSSVAYDREDNTVFATDGKTATASAYDSAHRLRKTVSTDGTKADLTVDGLNRTRTATVTNGGATLASYGASYVGPQLKHVDDNARKHDFAWDGAGRTKSAVLTGAEQPRLSQIVYDTAGRLGETKFGQGTLDGFDHVFADTSYDFGKGNSELPVTAKSVEDESHTQNWTLDHDTSGQRTHAGIDGSEFNFDHHFDESGNVTSSKTPARRGETTYDHDARGFTTTEQQPAAQQPIKYDPDASGALKQYIDPTGEPTKVTNDGLGRPVVREYADHTFEEIHYDGARVDFTRDRQKREQHFVYNDPAGRLTDVTSGTGVVLDHIEYENGRVVRWKTPDADVVFSDFDADNHPQQITQHRLGAGNTEIDTYTITHSWNAAGELVHTGMPSYQGMSAGGRWATSIDYKYDANGNVRNILRNNAQLFDASFRGAGRPITRDLTLPNGSLLKRAYDYDDQSGSVGRLSGMRVTAGGLLIAGSSITFEGLQRKSEQLLGLAGGQRYMTFDYDDRGRIKGSLAATLDPNAIPQLGMPGAAIVKLNDADFRSELDRTVAQQNDPPSTITTATTNGHKVATITKGATSETLLYRGADGLDVSVRTDDAKYHYEFDEKEHLRSITEQLITNGTQSRLLRVGYAYDGFGRIVGRRVEMAPISNGQPPTETDWTLATPDLVSTQPLPAATTFVWDPVTDNLLAIFPEGASVTHAQPLRQFIHGGVGMDDPIEVVTADARLFPIFDEPGAGNLQAVIGESGQLLARGLMADPYAEEQVAITAPAVDGVKLEAKKDASGNLTQVTVTMHVTEPLDAATVATGTRLAALAADATLVRTATTGPAQPDANTILWTLPAADWTALTADAKTLSIAATSSLRSITYGIQIPILPATPDMESAGNVFSTATLPIEIREPIATIQTQFTTTGTDTPFTLPTLTGLGAAASIADSLILSPFQGLPFVEPMSGMVNARERFYDPRTGNFISADPMGNIDSANLYAFCGGDPVNCSDPTGLQGVEERDPVEEAEAERMEWEHFVRLARRPMRPTARVYAEGSDPDLESRETTPFFLLSPGQRMLGGKTADAMTPAEQVKFLAHRRRLRTDPAYRAQWQRMTHTNLADVMPITHGQVPMLPGVTPYSQQIQANPTLAPQLSGYHNDQVRKGTGALLRGEPATHDGRDLNTIVLGHYDNFGVDNYIAAGEKLNAHTFDVPPSVWAKMSRLERRAANKRFLDRAITRSARILLKTPVQDAQPGSAYEWELQYLYQHGYRPTPDGIELVRSGGN